MPLEYACRDLVDLRPVRDVAELELPSDLGSDPLEVLGTAGEEHAVPAPSRQLARGRLPDSGRGARDDRYPPVCHRRGTLSI